MGNLPKNWRAETVGSFMIEVKERVDPTESNSTNYIGLEHIKSRGGLIGKGNSTEVRSTKTVFKANDILYGKLRPYLNKHVIVDFDGVCSTDILVYRNSNITEAKYFNYWLDLDSSIKQINAEAKGINLPRVSASTINSFEIPVPPPDQLERIVGKLDVLFAHLDQLKARLEKIPTLLKQFRQAVLTQAVSGRLTKEWRGFYPDANGSTLLKSIEKIHQDFGGHKKGNSASPTDGVHNLDLDELPDTWTISELKSLCKPDSPITYGILMPGPELKEGVSYIRVADFPNDRLNFASIRKTSIKIDEEFKRSRLKAGDLLLSIRGTVGRICEIPEELDGANITQDSARLRILSEISSTYVLWVLRSPSTQQRMRNATKGVAVRGINIGDVRALQIPLPPLHEQKEIVRRIESLFAVAERIETSYLKLQGKIDTLPRSILSKAFRGELVSSRYDEDLNDAVQMVAEAEAVLLKEKYSAKRSR